MKNAWLNKMYADMDELTKKFGAYLARHYHPTDFSNISGFPNLGDGDRKLYTWLPIFHGNYGESTIWHIKSFL